MFGNNNDVQRHGGQGPPPAGFSFQQQQQQQQHPGQGPPPPRPGPGPQQNNQAYGINYTGRANPDGGNRGGLQWVSASNGHIPPNAVQGGIEKDGTPLFVARAIYKGGLHPGKAGQHLEGGGCNIGFSHKEVAVSEYQVLCGDASRLRWVRQEGPLVIQGFVPYPAGHEESGEPLYIAKTLYDGSQQLGKCAPHIKKGMSFPYSHKEKTTDSYMVLAQAD
ncbi:hypothetical protein IWW48_005040 [Coemansia sp. RSA 1200]|nr:hypothetical protein IWW48_005040 [Coemansia sp. RSA 1200]